MTDEYSEFGQRSAAALLSCKVNVSKSYLRYSLVILLLYAVMK